MGSVCRTVGTALSQKGTVGVLNLPSPRTALLLPLSLTYSLFPFQEAPQLIVPQNQKLGVSSRCPLSGLLLQILSTTRQLSDPERGSVLSSSSPCPFLAFQTARVGEVVGTGQGDDLRLLFNCLSFLLNTRTTQGQKGARELFHGVAGRADPPRRLSLVPRDTITCSLVCTYT